MRNGDGMRAASVEGAAGVLNRAAAGTLQRSSEQSGVGQRHRPAIAVKRAAARLVENNAVEKQAVSGGRRRGRLHETIVDVGYILLAVASVSVELKGSGGAGGIDDAAGLIF